VIDENHVGDARFLDPRVRRLQSQPPTRLSVAEQGEQHRLCHR